MDGVLVDTKQLYITSITRILENSGIRVAEGEVERILGETFDKVIEILVKAHINSNNVRKIINRLAEKTIKDIAQHTSQIKLLPYVKRILNYLRNRNYKIAMITNCEKIIAYKILKEHNIKKLFDLIITPDHNFPLRPDPKIINYIIKYFNAKPAGTLFIGDRVTDIIAGHRADCKIAFVLTGFDANKTINDLDPFHILKNLSELPSKLENWEIHTCNNHSILRALSL